MAEIDRLEQLVRLARREEPPACDLAAATMKKVRAAGRPRPEPAEARWGRMALLLAASTAAAVLAIVLLLAARDGSRAGGPGAPGNVVERGTPKPVLSAPSAPSAASASAASVEFGSVAPALDILGTLESEVDQMMGSVAPGTSGGGQEIGKS